jgi:hypothetical protein
VALYFLWDLDERIVLVALLALFLLAAELGYRAGRRAAKQDPQVATIQGALLGLLALLLGFSFAMAQSRYDARRALVVDEANAIGTAYLRTQLLSGPEGPEIAAALRRYVDVRLARLGHRVDEFTLRGSIAETEQRHEYMWARAMKAAQHDPRPAVSLLIAALNEVIDLHGKRLAAFRNHVPASVFLLLYFVAAVAMAVSGYASGLAGRRSLWPTAITAALIAVVIVVTMDLDRPQRGLITVSQQSMIDLRDSMNRPPR